jgi:hypothetical protein
MSQMSAAPHPVFNVAASHWRCVGGAGAGPARNDSASIPGHARKYATFRVTAPRCLTGHQAAHLHAKKIASATIHIQTHGAASRPAANAVATRIKPGRNRAMASIVFELFGPSVPQLRLI